MPFPFLAAATLGAGALGLAGSLAGSAQSARAQADANEMNYTIARENREWQERMDNTKYQRGVSDARAAGFNPLVAFPGSAGTPIPSTPVMHSTAPNRGELYLSTANALSDLMLKKEMTETEDTKQEVNRAQASGWFGMPGFFNIPANRVFSHAGSAMSNAQDWMKTSGKSANVKAQNFKSKNPKAYSAWSGNAR